MGGVENGDIPEAEPGTSDVEPGLAEVVAEAVRVDVGAALAAPAGDGLVEAAGGHRPAVICPEPDLGLVGLGVPGAGAQIPVERAGGVVADLHGARLASLAGHRALPVPQIPFQRRRIPAR